MHWLLRLLRLPPDPPSLPDDSQPDKKCGCESSFAFSYPDPQAHQYACAKCGRLSPEVRVTTPSVPQPQGLYSQKLLWLNEELAKQRIPEGSVVLARRSRYGALSKEGVTYELDSYFRPDWITANYLGRPGTWHWAKLD